MAFEGPSGLHDELAQGFHPLSHLVHCKDKATISSVSQGQAPGHSGPRKVSGSLASSS